MAMSFVLNKNVKYDQDTDYAVAYKTGEGLEYQKFLWAHTDPTFTLAIISQHMSVMDMSAISGLASIEIP